ncbi:hypothetical protein AA3266_2652 [Gluconobacter kondonii NBRC 3266]|nr:hypothetical protein AA3266_2652 [Gluconobacter kondonii NBRC 3266]
MGFLTMGYLAKKVTTDRAGKEVSAADDFNGDAPGNDDGKHDEPAPARAKTRPP